MESNVFAYNVSLSVVHEVEVVVAKERVIGSREHGASKRLGLQWLQGSEDAT